MKIAYSLAEEDHSAAGIATLIKQVDQRVGKFKDRFNADSEYIRIAYKAASTVGLKDDPMKLWTIDDILNNKEQLEEIIEGWLHSTGFMIVTGQPGVGKTQFAMDLMHTLATGQKTFLGREVKYPKDLESMKGMFLSLEMQPVDLSYLYQDKHQLGDPRYKKYKDTLLQDNILIYSPLEGYDGENVEILVQRHKPNFIVIDSLSELFSEDMKEAESRKVIRHLLMLKRMYNLALIVVHHNRKATDSNKKPNKLSDLYGSFIFAKTVDTVLGLWHNEKNNTYELLGIKTRFGKNNQINIRRTEYLTYEVAPEEGETKGANNGTSGAKPSPKSPNPNILDFN